jgi:hypothetical protein
MTSQTEANGVNGAGRHVGGVAKKKEVQSFVLIGKLLHYLQLLIRGIEVNHPVSAACKACT